MAEVTWDASKFLDALAALNPKVQQATKTAVNMWTAAVVRQAVLNATGPARSAKSRASGVRGPVKSGPYRGASLSHQGGGPGVVTGNLRRSILAEPARFNGREWIGRAYPSAIYGRRVELGFHGADARGRVYNQPPYPYLAPAARYITSQGNVIYIKAFERIFR